MHMTDALLSPTVGLAMCAVSATLIGVSAARVKNDELSESKIPVMGVAGAMVFAGQMINFTIPATGSSGHIVGGILLAGLLGGVPAFLTISAALIIQCLFFADGGLLALGCNIFNMGVIPCLLVYPLVFKRLLKGRIDGKRLSIASITSAAIGIELGAFCVVLQTLLSGITALPFGTFAVFMLPIHLIIGLVEGSVTAAILCFVYKTHPEIIDASQSESNERQNGGVSVKKVLVAFIAITIIAGSALSLFASSHPDALEWAIGKTTEQTIGAATEPESDGGVFDGAASVQENISFLPNYRFASDPDNTAGTPVSGLLGAAITFALAAAAGLVITKLKRIKKGKANV